MDILVLGIDGNLGDLVYIAVYAALFDLQKPMITVYANENDSSPNFEVDPHKTEPFLKDMPVRLCLRISLFELSPGQFVADASQVCYSFHYLSINTKRLKKNAYFLPFQ